MGRTNGQAPFGYQYGSEGVYIVSEPEAGIVRRIYEDFLSGGGILKITRDLNERGIPNSKGEKWCHSTINYMLKNTKYCGGRNYPAIIPQDKFEQVQMIRKERAVKANCLHGEYGVRWSRYPFSMKIYCGDCGSIFKRNIIHSGKPCAKPVWRCKNYVVDGKVQCKSGGIDESILEQLFVRVYNRLLSNKALYCAVSGPSAPISEPASELDVLLEKCLSQLESAATNHVADTERLEADARLLIQEKISRIWAKVKFDDRDYQSSKLLAILQATPKRMTVFDAAVFKSVVKEIVVTRSGHLYFELINGQRIPEAYDVKSRQHGKETDLWQSM